MTVDSDSRSGRLSSAITSENVERGLLAIEEDIRLTIRELISDLGVQKTTIRKNLTENLVMALGFTAIIHKQSDNLHMGDILIRQDQKITSKS